MPVNITNVANQCVQYAEITTRNVLLIEGATIVRRFDRTDLDRTNQRYLE